MQPRMRLLLIYSFKTKSNRKEKIVWLEKNMKAKKILRHNYK